MFINLSNHPSLKWNEEQKNAAIEMGGRIIDMPFPPVPADADEEWISKKAREVVEEIKKVSEPINPVMVQGEFTLTFAVVSRLISEGFIPVAATTERIVEERDGKKVVTFNFKGFRRYVK